MALVDLLYRCPECGHDPMEGEGDEARCPECSRQYHRGDGRTTISISQTGHPSVDIPAAVLVERIERRGGPLTRATTSAGGIHYEAEVLISFRQEEDPVWHKGSLLGFTERMGEPEPGRLVVGDDEVTVRWGDGREQAWGYLEIMAVQAASSALQLSVPGDQLVQFRFLRDSPRRWEDLLRRLVTAAYHREGRGKVVEFQPRIQTL